MVGVLASNPATWIVEPTNANSGADGYEARKLFRTTDTTTHYASTAAKQLFQDIATDMMTTKGGLVVLRNGIYGINGPASGNIWGWVDWPPDDTDGLDYQIVLRGETRDGVIIKDIGGTGADDILFTAHGNFSIENVTFDGDNLAANGMNLLQFHNGDNPYEAGIRVRNCRFRKHTSIGFLTDKAKYVELFDSYFELPNTNGDQAAIGQSEGWCHIAGNTFERLTGSGELDGSSLTSGCMMNGNIHDNIIKREPGHIVMGISLEPFDTNPDYLDINIHNNQILNGAIRIGGLGTWSTLYHNIHVYNNTLHGADVSMFGPESGITDQIMNNSITGNKILDPYYEGILVSATSGQVIVKNNEITNSNIAQDATTFDKGCIYLADTKDIVCENNSLYMGVVDPEDPKFSPYGIALVGTTNDNPTVRNNRIRNRTVANPNYVLSGSRTGNVLISKSS
jgi:hypothetical protein